MGQLDSVDLHWNSDSAMGAQMTQANWAMGTSEPSETPESRTSQASSSQTSKATQSSAAQAHRRNHTGGQGSRSQNRMVAHGHDGTTDKRERFDGPVHIRNNRLPQVVDVDNRFLDVVHASELGHANLTDGGSNHGDSSGSSYEGASEACTASHEWAGERRSKGVHYGSSENCSMGSHWVGSGVSADDRNAMDGVASYSRQPMDAVTNHGRAVNSEASSVADAAKASEVTRRPEGGS